ncbi:hypothetical protein ACFPIJ_40545 [Dactylosporangium cerinum]|uniref:PIN domain-containing protein n=1 Tax=Dactylosporangium cerinum TaxID=1434730 RepID=A0ABV9W764_9ACTN
MTEAQFALDTTAVLAYVAGSHSLGELLGEIADEKARFAVPAVCLVEAATMLENVAWPMLDLLAAHPCAVVVSLDGAQWRPHAAAAHVYGGVGAGAAALLFVQERVFYVATCDPAAYGDGIDTVAITD